MRQQDEIDQGVFERYVRAACREVGVTEDQMFGTARTARHVLARRLLATALHEAGHSVASVGRMMGAGDHTTTLHQVRSADDETRRLAVEMAADLGSSTDPMDMFGVDDILEIGRILWLHPDFATESAASRVATAAYRYVTGQ